MQLQQLLCLLSAVGIFVHAGSMDDLEFGAPYASAKTGQEEESRSESTADGLSMISPESTADVESPKAKMVEAEGSPSTWWVWALLVLLLALLGCLAAYFYSQRGEKKRGLKKQSTEVAAEEPAYTQVAAAAPITYAAPAAAPITYAAPGSMYTATAPVSTMPVTGSVSYAAGGSVGMPVYAPGGSVSYAAGGSTYYPVAAPIAPQSMSLFDAIDTNHSGAIDRAEFLRAQQEGIIGQ